MVLIQFSQFVVHFESEPTVLDVFRRQKGVFQQLDVPGTIVVVLCRLVCNFIQIEPKTVARRCIEPIFVAAGVRGGMEEDQAEEEEPGEVVHRIDQFRNYL